MAGPDATRGGNRPLNGLRVLDFTQIMAGPHCSRLLADLGADVIKVEPPGGDQMRLRPPMRDGRSAYFGHMNCGKRSLCLDLSKDAARAVARDLAAESDIVVESFRPGVMQRFGLDYAALAPDMPKLIYCSLSGFGQTGPYADRPAFAPLINAMSGHDLVHMRYQEDAETPPRAGIFIADVLTGVYAFGAIQTALIQRSITGQGQHIDVSILEAMATLMIYEYQEAQFPADRQRLTYKPLRAADGFIILAPFTQKNYDAMFRAIGRAELTADPRFATHAAREANWSELMGIVEAWTLKQPVAECERLFLAADCPAARYRGIDEMLDDPQIAHRGQVTRARDAAGAFAVPNAPFLMSGAETAPNAWVADLGEHSRDVLEGLLGYDAKDVDALIAAGAVVQPG